MFRRLVLEESAAIFTIVAFVTALTIYVAFTWRALRMKRPQLARFENLPFETETPATTAPHPTASNCPVPTAAARVRTHSKPVR